MSADPSGTGHLEGPRSPGGSTLSMPPNPSSAAVFVADEQTSQPVDAQGWAQLAREILRAEKAETELSVLFVDEVTIAGLNRRFLGLEGPTDVLAFPIDDELGQRGRSPDGGGTGPGWLPPEASEVPGLLGDVVICPEVACRNAEGRGGSYEDELALLLVHGILHLIGMDHDQEPDAAAMEQREQELLDRFYRRKHPARRDEQPK